MAADPRRPSASAHPATLGQRSSRQRVSVAVGDPACDTTIAWTFFSGEGREAFRANLPVDEATWVRGRGWALWKALITLNKDLKTKPQGAATCRRIIDDVIAERLAGI